MVLMGGAWTALASGMAVATRAGADRSRTTRWLTQDRMPRGTPPVPKGHPSPV